MVVARLSASALALGLLAAAPACKSQEVTAPGTKIVEWGVDKTSLEEVKKGKLGPKKSKVFTISLVPPDKQGGPVGVRLTVENAPIDVMQLNRVQLLKTPVTVVAEVTANSGYVASGRCEQNPAYQLPSTTAGGDLITPTAMFVDCAITLQRGEAASYGTRLRVFGDGTVTYDGNFDTGVVITDAS